MSYAVYIGTFLLIGIIVLALTGLGILTNALFNISPIKTSGQDPLILDFIEKNKLSSNTLVVPTIPNAVETGNYTINLAGANLIISKIGLITIWVIMAIGFIALLATFMSDY